MSALVSCLMAAFWFHSHAAKLGAQLAALHLDNKKLGERLQKEAGTVGMGFCGPRGALPGGGHLGVWLCCSHVRVRPGSVPKQRAAQPKVACLGRREHSQCNTVSQVHWKDRKHFLDSKPHRMWVPLPSHSPEESLSKFLWLSIQCLSLRQVTHEAQNGSPHHQHLVQC